MNDDNDLKEYSDVISAIKKDGDEIIVPKALLSSVLEKTRKEKDENLSVQEGSRPSLLVNLFIHMSKQAYVVAVVAVVVLAGGAFWYTKNPAIAPENGNGNVQQNGSQQSKKVRTAILTTEVANEVGAFDADLADINDFNSAANEVDLDALTKDLALLNSI